MGSFTVGMGLNHTPAMFIPMRVKAFLCNILKRFKARARGPKGCKIYCFNQYGRRVIKAYRDHTQNTDFLWVKAHFLVSKRSSGTTLLSLDATIIVSKNYPIIGEHIVIVFFFYSIGYYSNSMTFQIHSLLQI